MPSQEEYNNALWLAYCNAIKGSWAPAGSGDAIFFPEKGQLGPAAGSQIHPAFTNFGMFQLADNLLHDDNLLYKPDRSNSYSAELLSYMSYVDLEARVPPPMEQQIEMMINRQQSSMKALQQSKIAAEDQFGKILKAGIIRPGIDFAQWTAMEYPRYTSALREFYSAYVQIDEMQMQMPSPKSSSWTSDRARIVEALYGCGSQNGINMEVSHQKFQQAAELWQAQAQDSSGGDPQATAYAPYYDASGYSKVAADFVEKSKANQESTSGTSEDINFERGDRVNISGFGPKSLNRDKKIQLPWFAAVDRSGRDDSGSGLRNDDQQKTSITVKWTDRKLVPMEPAQWDIKKSNYRLTSNAPDSAKKLYRPAQLVCLNNLAYEVKFQGGAVDEVDRYISAARHGAVELFLFGWALDIEGSAPSDNPTHTVDWDKESGTLNVNPKQVGLNAYVAAIVGEKVNRD